MNNQEQEGTSGGVDGEGGEWWRGKWGKGGGRWRLGHLATADTVVEGASWIVRNTEIAMYYKLMELGVYI